MNWADRAAQRGSIPTIHRPALIKALTACVILAGDLAAVSPAMDLQRDWLRVGTDTVGVPTAPTFNFSFPLEGNPVPLPATLPLFATGIGGLGLLGWRRKRKAQAGA
jgi:hypothetical protein